VPLLAGDAQGARGATCGPNSIAYARPGTLTRRWKPTVRVRSGPGAGRRAGPRI